METVFIGIPVLNRLDLLSRSIDAFDYPRKVLIINNSTDVEFRRELQHLAKIKQLTVLHQRRNLGVAASWNLIIRTALAEGHEWIFIGSNDTILRPGSLKAAAETHKANDVGVWHLHSFNFFLLRKKTIELVGWFDENFYPAYREDQDYSYRCQLAGVNRQPGISGCEAEHVGSATLNSDPEFAAYIQRVQIRNLNYYRMKWGDEAGNEIYRHPYDNPVFDHTWWPAPRPETRL